MDVIFIIRNVLHFSVMGISLQSVETAVLNSVMLIPPPPLPKKFLPAPARNSSSSPEDTATQSAEPQPTREKAAVPQSEDQPSEPVAQEEWVVL